MKKLVLGSLAFSLMALSSCSEDEPDNQPPANNTQPTLSTPFLSVASTTRFIVFGDTLDGTQIVNNNYEITLADSSVMVVASCNGTVTQLTDNGGGEFYIEVTPFKNSIYRIGYNRVLNPTVALNDVIDAGNIIGRVGRGGRSTLHATKDGSFICPALLGSAGFNNAMDFALQLSNSYNSDTVPATCL